MRSKHLVAILVLLMLVVPATPAHAGGIVSVCDEAHLLAALAGGGMVTFTCSGTITLTATITVAANTTLDGSGQAVTISGNHLVRVFSVNSGITLNLNGLNVTNGWASGGGGILNSGVLTVSNSTFTGNFSNGSGGGILNYSTVTVSNSTFFSNRSEEGGGIANQSGAVTVSNSTFFGNYGIDGGGGLYNNSGGTVTVSNSTFSDNHGSLSFGGGGIYNATGTVILKNTIVANSSEGGNCDGTITDGGGNLSYPDTTCPGINSDPMLGILQNYGGPTYTMALLPGSAAIDVGIDATCAASPINNRDQRGIARPQGAHCDIGAVEQYCPSFVPPATVDVEDIVAIATRWGWTNTSPGWDPAYDLNGDNRIDIVDITLVTKTWGAMCS